MKRYEPMLAKSAETPFSSEDWIFEVKWDGIRAISYVDGEMSIRSRNQKELKNNFPEFEELRKVAEHCVLDGEIVVMKEGRVDFQTLMERAQKTSQRDIEYMARKFPATYVIFDILEKDGKSLIEVPLIERKKLLKKSVREGEHVVLSLFAEVDGEAFYDAALKRGMEGVMAKKKLSPYEPGARSANWLKIKKVRACDCAVFGYTEGEGRRGKTFGALVLGLYDGDKPVYVGKVGTGFSEGDLEHLIRSFRKLAAKEETLSGVDAPEKIVWLRPSLVCEVGYQSVTKDGRLRMPRFRGLRVDKTAAECTLDQIRPKALEEYMAKRNFSRTTEPLGGIKKAVGKSFVIHEHHARKLHYDLRLEREGVLKSWAVPKGPPQKPGEKRLAVETEDHPLDYGEFQGTIPEGQYGAGEVRIWDRGLYEPMVWGKDKIEFVAKGRKLAGRYVLVKFKRAGKKDWLLLKAKD